jgi:DNA polymerase (family X)
MDKHEVAQVLENISILMQIKGENLFKIRAYENAARTIGMLDESLAALVQEDKLKEVKGIGNTLAGQIAELVTTGCLEFYEELRRSVPPGLFDLLKIPGLGPKKVKALFDNVSISTIGELEYACIENRLLDLPGFGKKTQDKILQGITYIKQYQGQFLISDILPVAERLIESLRKHPAVIRAELGGSLRRKKEVIRDIDILVSSAHPQTVAEFFVGLPGVAAVIGQGETKVSVTLAAGMNVDLRVVTDVQFPYGLHHFTGSKEHNTAMRHRAKEMGYKINEYGLFKGESLIPCRDEKEFFAALGLQFIPPELREDHGEIAAAEQGQLPALVELSDLKGIFHIHTVYSDGSATLLDMAEAARARGYQYIGITDHSRSAAYARGLKEETLQQQLLEIDMLNQHWQDFRILKGIESDILVDGVLDYSDDILRQFDFVIASVHSHFRMAETEMTNRIVKAMENPYVTMLGHPTGRLLLAREGYPLNMTAIIEAAARTKTFIEINASPYRLDLDWRWCKYAKEKGVMLSINPDAHAIEELDAVRYGVGIARKGWLTAEDVANTRSLPEIDHILKRKR